MNEGALVDCSCRSSKEGNDTKKQGALFCCGCGFGPTWPNKQLCGKHEAKVKERKLE
jgi:hypothetical protein